MAEQRQIDLLPAPLVAGVPTVATSLTVNGAVKALSASDTTTVNGGTILISGRAGNLLISPTGFVFDNGSSTFSTNFTYDFSNKRYTWNLYQENTVLGSHDYNIIYDPSGLDLTSLPAVKVPAPTAANHAVTRGYADALIKPTFTPAAAKSAVTGTAESGWANNELSGTQPSGSLPGMRFRAGNYQYWFGESRADTDGTQFSWVRILISV